MELAARRPRAIDWTLTCDILRDVAGSLAYLRHKGIVHSDLNPTNICVDDNQATLIDFGRATRLNDGSVRFGFRWSEFLPLDDRVTPAVDVYSLGALAWFLTCTGSHAEATWRRRRSIPFRSFVPASGRDYLRPLIEKCLQMDWKRRDEDGEECIAAFQLLRALAP